MKSYNLQSVKNLLNEKKYRELTLIVNDIKDRDVYDKEDMDILNYLYKNKDINAYLYEAMVKIYDVFQKKFISNISDSNNNEYIIDNGDYSNLYEEEKDNKIIKEYFTSEDEEMPRILIRFNEKYKNICYDIMNKIYDSREDDIGFELINEGNNLEHTLLVYLLPSKMVDNVILNQINIMIDIVNSCISNKNNNVVLKYDLENLVNRFEDSKKIHSFNMFKVGYIYVKGNKRVYINIDNREQDLIFDNIKKAYQNRKIVSYDNTPYTFSANLAYANSNMIGFVIVLIIIVIIVVTILTLGG